MSLHVITIIRPSRALALAVAVTLAGLSATELRAGSASWVGPDASDWNIVTNWNPQTIPNGPEDTATFGAVDPSSLPLVTSPIELNGIVFTTLCPEDYTIEVDGQLTISGAGINNQSGNAKFIYVKPYPAGELDFTNSAVAGDNSLVISAVSEAVRFYDDSSAGSALFTVDSPFSDYPEGLVEFNDDSDGGTALVNIGQQKRGELPGVFSIYKHNSPGVRIGRLEGGGIVLLGAEDGPSTGRRLSVGAGNQSSTYEGIIQDAGKGGSLAKIGTGSFVLTGANTYSGPTFVRGGKFIVANTSGSGTGTGPVKVVGAAALSGTGTIAGAVTIGDGTNPGSILKPSGGVGAASLLTIRSLLTFQNGGSYEPQLFLSGRSNSDSVAANGVRIESGALFDFAGADQVGVPLGSVYLVIRNRSATPIAGTFANLPDGEVYSAGSNHFQANYEGGDGNDLTLTAVP